MIKLVDITKSFNKGKPNEFTALNNVSLSIESRKATVFKGPSGSGKTTLLSVIGCMTRPTTGRVWFADKEITSLPERFLTEIRRKTFGFIFQQFNLIKGISAFENVMLPAYPYGEDYGLIKNRTHELMELFGMSKKMTSKVEWLSGGESQRIAIARALINNPEVIIADEPTAHLDTKLSQEFMEIVGRLKSEGRTVLIASHDPIVYDSQVVDNIIEMRDGMIVGNTSIPPQRKE